MQLARILKCLAVSAPALVAALTLACAEGAPTTAPDQSPAIAAATGGSPLYVNGKPLTIDDDDSLGCANGYALAFAPRGDYWDLWDFNGNDHVCRLITFVD